MLAACLTSLLDQQDIDATSRHLIVVDNDATPSSASVVEEMSARFDFPVHYHHESRRGIPMARNRVLQEAVKLRADWLAFLDDDQFAEPDWIEKSLFVARRDGADVVRARAISVAPENPPFWWFDRKEDAELRLEDGPLATRLLRRSATSGVFLSARIFDPKGFGLRFDERLSLAGQEDGEFFKVAYRNGARIVRSNLPIVNNAFHPSRHTYLRYAKNGLAQGSAHASHYRFTNGFWKTLARYSVVAPMRIFRGALQVLTSPVYLPFKPDLFKETALEGGRNLFFAIGTIQGLFGRQYGYYLQIDGD